MKDGYSGSRDIRTVGKTGLVPARAFVWKGAEKLPDDARTFVVEGLLEAEPESWINAPEFPGVWDRLMHDICMKTDFSEDPRINKIMLLSFELKPTDKAYVAERAHIERFYSKLNNDTLEKAVRKYWESRVPVFDYDGNYSVPLLAIWTPIAFERLNVEWIKTLDDVRKMDFVKF